MYIHNHRRDDGDCEFFFLFQYFAGHQSLPPVPRERGIYHYKIIVLRVKIISRRIANDFAGGILEGKFVIVKTLF